MQRLLSKAEASALVGLHRVSLMRLVKQGNFPQPIKFSRSKGSRVRFALEDVEQWLSSRKADNNLAPMLKVADAEG
jgi:excisionase family DNA binding protein